MRSVSFREIERHLHRSRKGEVVIPSGVSPTLLSINPEQPDQQEAPSLSGLFFSIKKVIFCGPPDEPCRIFNPCLVHQPGPVMFHSPQADKKHL